MSAPDHVPHRSRRFLLLLNGRPHMSQTVLSQSSVFGGGIQKRVQGFQGLTDAHKLEKLTLQQNRLTRMSRRCRLALSRPRLLRHRIACYAARAAGESSLTDLRAARTFW